MKITRDAYEKMLRDAFGSIANHRDLNARHQATNIVDNFLIDMDIPIPEKSILPGVTDGTWEVVKYLNGDEWIIHSGDKACPIAQKIYSEPDAKAMAGSKKLVELVVADLRHCGVVYADSSVMAIIAQLKKMDVDVSEFEGDE